MVNAEADWMNAHTDLALHGPAIAKKRAAARVKLARPTALPRMTDEAFVDLYRDQWRGHANREHPMVDALRDPSADVFTVAGEQPSAPDIEHGHYCGGRNADRVARCGTVRGDEGAERLPSVPPGGGVVHPRSALAARR